MKDLFFAKFLQSSNTRQFIGGTGIAFVLTTAGKGLFYLVQLVFARVLGAEGYGVYIYVFTMVTLLSIFSTMGFDSVLLKYLAIYRARHEWALFRGMIARTIQIPLVLSLALAIIVIGAASCINRVTDNTVLYSTLIAGSLSLPFFTFLKILLAYFRSQKQITLSLFPNEIGVPFLLVAGVGGYGLLTGAQPHSASVMAYHGIVMFSVLAFFSYFCFRQLAEKEVLSAEPRFRTGEWARTAGSLLMISGMHIILAQSDIILLGVFRGTTDAGIYAVAAKIAILVTFGLQIGNQIIAPMISEIYHEGDEARLQELVSYGTLISTTFAVIVVLGILFFANPILRLFGSEFTGGRLPLYILAGGQLVNALVGPVGFIMTMTKHHREASIIIAVSAAVNIILNILFIPRYGMVGAAMATTLTMVGWNIVFWYYIYRNIGINTLVSSFFVRKINA